MIHQPYSRRRFVAVLPAFIGGTLLGATPLAARAVRGGRRIDHPEPRPGIDASKVLTADEIAMSDAVAIYDGIREIPHIADGILCHCGCATLPNYRSLLTCYEEFGMAQFCEICKGQGRLAYRRFKEGQSLDQIRRAIDARFAGSGGGPAANLCAHRTP